MNNISDEELDRLFKDSADNFDPPFDPEAWVAMDQKLEQVQPRPRWFRRFYPALLLLTLVGLVIVTKVTQDSNKTQPAQAQMAVQQKESRSTQANTSNQKRTQVGVEALSSAKAREEAVAGGKPVSRPNPEKKPQNGSATPEETKEVAAGTERDNKFTSADHRRSTSNRNAVKVTIASGGSSLQSTPNRGNVTKGEQMDDRVGEPNAGSAGAVTLSEPEREETLLQPGGELRFALPALALPETLEKATIGALTVTQQDSGTTGNSKQELPKTSHFLSSVQVAVAFAPDLTTVKFKDPGSMSANAGVLVGVPLTKRLSLVSGVVWANKVYSAQPEEYDFSSGYTYHSQIDATCKVLDIPLNLRYTVLASQKNSLAVQAGLSSYLMLKEEYTSGSGYGYYTYHYEVKNENQHWFKVQNVSLVYTRAISPVFSVGVEPFVKVPLSGIGAGKVKLTSAGVFFSAGYTLKRKP